MTVSSSRRAVERPPAATSRTAISGSGQAVEQRLDARRVRAVAHERRVRAGAEGQPQRVDDQALAGAGLAGDDVEPRLERQPQALDEGEVGDRELQQSPGHDGSSATLWRSRSQKGCAPVGSMRRIGRSTARDLDDVADPDRDVLAPVDRDQRLVGVHDAAAHDLSRAHDDGPDGREVGGDRRDHEVAADRVDDRAAGRERVAGRAGRGRDRRGRRR